MEPFPAAVGHQFIPQITIHKVENGFVIETLVLEEGPPLNYGMEGDDVMTNIRMESQPPSKYPTPKTFIAKTLDEAVSKMTKYFSEES